MELLKKITRICAPALAAVFLCAALSSCSNKSAWTVTCPWAPSGIAALISQKTAAISARHSNDCVLVAEAIKGDAAVVNNWLMQNSPDDPSLVMAGEGMFSITSVIDPSKLKFKYEDFIYIANLYSAVFVLSCNQNVGISNLSELKAYLDSSEGAISLAVNGATSSEAFLAIALFSALGAQERLKLTPYASAAEAALAVSRGETQFAVSHQTQILESKEQGKVSVIAVFDASSPADGPFAGVDAVGEYGYPYFRNCCFILAKKGADPHDIENLRKLYADILADPELVNWLHETMLVQVDPLTEDEVQKHLQQVRTIVEECRELVL